MRGNKQLGKEVIKALTEQAAIAVYYRAKCIEMGVGEKEATDMATKYQAYCIEASLRNTVQTQIGTDAGKKIDLEKIAEKLAEKLKETDGKKMN